MSNYRRTANWLKACGKEQKNIEHITAQLGCFLEEVIELLDMVSSNNTLFFRKVINTKQDFHSLIDMIKNGQASAYITLANRENTIKELCDISVTVDGLAYLLGMDKESADQKVLDSNDAKLVNGKPVILPGGKIGKPEGWRGPDLSGCV